MHIGDKLYDMIINLNDIWAKIRARMGLPYWSMSRWVKHHTKQAVSYILSFEKLLADYCKKKGYDGIICGHIHTAEIRDIDGVIYMNDGDWVESCTALVEHWDGRWEVINWKGSEKNGMDHVTVGGAYQRSQGSTGPNPVWIRESRALPTNLGNLEV
jgi:UDP-2,3-diacylglucosamine pyrophosphatase LpxH